MNRLCGLSVFLIASFCALKAHTEAIYPREEKSSIIFFYILQNHQIFVVKIIFFIYYSFPGLSYHSVTTRSLRWYHISKSLFCEHHVMSYKIHGLPPSVTMKKAHKSIIIHIHGYFTPLKYRGIKKERRRRKQIFKTIKKDEAVRRRRWRKNVNVIYSFQTH